MTKWLNVEEQQILNLWYVVPKFLNKINMIFGENEETIFNTSMWSGLIVKQISSNNIHLTINHLDPSILVKIHTLSFEDLCATLDQNRWRRSDWVYMCNAFEMFNKADNIKCICICISVTCWKSLQKLTSHLLLHQILFICHYLLSQCYVSTSWVMVYPA